MSRFAPVVPLNVADALWHMGLLGSYHLLLAHDVLHPGNPSKYHEIYHDRVRIKYKDAIVIMDNSLVELGAAMDFEDCRQAAEVVRADYIVSADAFLDADLTIQRSIKFVEAWRQARVDRKYCPPLMGVVQGTTLQECMRVAGFFAHDPAFGGISVPRVITAGLGSRTPLLIEINKYYPDRFRCIHLLGFSDNNLDDICSARLPFVSGIDSAAPIRGGLNGIKFELPNTDFGKRGNYWACGLLQAMHAEEGIRHNLNAVRNNIDPL